MLPEAEECRSVLQLYTADGPEPGRVARVSGSMGQLTAISADRPLAKRARRSMTPCAVLLPALVLVGCSDLMWFGQREEPILLPADDNEAAALIANCRREVAALMDREIAIAGDIAFARSHDARDAGQLDWRGDSSVDLSGTLDRLALELTRERFFERCLRRYGR
jgi:hypothetical protein